MIAFLLAWLASCAPGDKDDDLDGEDTGTGGDSGADSGSAEEVVTSGDLSCPLPDLDHVAALSPDDLPSGPDPCRAPALVRVAWVTDGDTFHAVGESDGTEEDVRIIGVDTPETYAGPECYGEEASDFSGDVLSDRLLWLTFDYDCEDDYDRTLAYVQLDAAPSCFYERLLLRGGFAETMTFSATSTYADTFEDDERWARENAQGLWEECG